MVISYSSSKYHMQVGTRSKAIISNTLIESHYLVSPGQSIQQYEWRFMLMNVNIVFPPMPFPISTSSTTMPSSTKAMSTFKLSTTSMAKATRTDKDVMDMIKRKTNE